MWNSVEFTFAYVKCSFVHVKFLFAHVKNVKFTFLQFEMWRMWRLDIDWNAPNPNTNPKSDLNTLSLTLTSMGQHARMYM